MPSTENNAVSDHSRDDEPLLGGPGDASQGQRPLWYNLGLGTAVIAQAGIWIFVGVIWGGIFSHEIALFSAHPLLNSAGILLITEAILLLQPTSTASQKIRGTYAHAFVVDTGILALFGGLIVIVYNKLSHNGDHFESPHAILGLATYIIMGIQATFGAAAFFAPGLLGGEAKARSLYKYHRMSGYVVLILLFATVAAATYTTFNVGVLHIKLWAVVASAVITLVGIVPRIKKQKLGL